MDERGYITFELRWIKGAPPENALIAELDFWRTRCYDEGLIGQEPTGIGYGNVSVRIQGARRFVVSGTQTGQHRRLSASQYAKVLDWCIDDNHVVAIGAIAASSETLSHAAVYSADGRIRAVIHAHSKRLWEHLRDRIPTTHPRAVAGSPEIAREIQRLVPEALKGGRVIVMGGHANGLIAFGTSPAIAAEALLSLGRSV
ncbi:MAG: class II aldolase/adducin family protein [Rhodothermales bacterium]|nr:class II aldolase/adducin family protein [Rhodothermales bacterium]